VRTLTQRDLNRALLARQLLLERSRAPLPRVLERVAGIQAQYAPSSYIGLWSRVEGFSMDSLDRALERRSVVQGTLLRMTIHLVSSRDYPELSAGVREARRESWLRGHRGRASREQVEKGAAKARRALGDRFVARKELVELVGGTVVWSGVGAWVDLLRAPPSGTWAHRRADLYVTAEHWLGSSKATEGEGLVLLLRRYLAGFGPARIADAASWAGIGRERLEAAAERMELRRFEDQEGKELLDLPRAPLPAAKAKAPVRFLPVWDATTLAHARRTGILPEEYRELVFSTRTPQSVHTFLVDGAVAGKWSVKRTKKKAELAVQPFAALPQAARRELEDEGGRLLRFHEPDAESYAVRLGGRA
jgi:hypothetical protein